ncbi:hypothetical protein F5148DRAFT_1349141 [Russula earlei]|uniref:Uncharacterized protein n=1 Tax=Russula earlei TaxID=71964 RepID=A0ACC0TU01_9AGAM|nr:hypothetical protein F5148DRAFT_1349141 [Russula earlei]
MGHTVHLSNHTAALPPESVDLDAIRDWCHVIGLEMMKDLRAQLLSDCAGLAPGDIFSKYGISASAAKDNANLDALKRKLQLEEDKHSEMLSLVKDLTCPLERAKGDLTHAEKARAKAMVEKAENCLSCGGNTRHLIEDVVAREEAEEVYITQLADLHLKIQSLEQEVHESNRLRILLEDTLESEITQCQYHHADVRHSTRESTIGPQDLNQRLDPVYSSSALHYPNMTEGYMQSHGTKKSRFWCDSHQKRLFFVSTIIAFIAIAIQFALEADVPHNDDGHSRPGWAQHRSDGWEHGYGG